MRTERVCGECWEWWPKHGPDCYHIDCDDDDRDVHGCGVVNDDVPSYSHDCQSCVFLGRYGNKDLYVCPPWGGLPGSVIARFGYDGPEYESMPANLKWFVDAPGQHPLVVARHRAVQQGILPALTIHTVDRGW